MENLDNWHGKPLSKKSGLALEAVKKLITQPGPHGLTPLSVVDDAPKFSFPKVTLNEPPKYILGDKVCGCVYMCVCVGVGVGVGVGVHVLTYVYTCTCCVYSVCVDGWMWV